MRIVYIVFINLLLSINSFGQVINDFGKITLSVVMPENVDGLDDSQLSKLESKIAQIVTNSGLASTGYNNNFVIYPKFALYDVTILEGGMQNMTVVTAELSLFIKQVDNNLLFATISKSLKGSGSNKELAITNAISKITTNESDFKSFIESGKQKIIAYYETKCIDIIKKSESFLIMQDYDKAIALLMSVPEEVPSCYNNIQDKAIEAYKAFQTQKCSELIQKAKSSMSSNDYIGALNSLSKIDPSTKCFTEVQLIVKSAEAKINAEEKKQWDFQMKQYNDAVNLEKRRIEAIKEIAISYYKSVPSRVSYYNLIK